MGPLMGAAPAIHGKPIKKLTGDNILDQFMDEIYKL